MYRKFTFNKKKKSHKNQNTATEGRGPQESHYAEVPSSMNLPHVLRANGYNEALNEIKDT